MRTILLFLFAALLTHAAHARVPQGDESAFVPESIGQSSINGKTWGVSVDFFQSIRGNASGLASAGPFAVSPYFLFVPSPDGKIYRERPNPDGSRTIILRLLLSTDELRTIAAVQLSQILGTTVRKDQVLSLPITKLRVWSPGLPAVQAEFPPSGAPPLARAVLSPVQDVFFESLDTATASLLVAGLDSALVNFNFDYSFKKAATSLGAYSVRMTDITKTGTFQAVSGAGGVGLVTRDGISRVSTSVVSQLEIRSYLEDAGVERNLLEDVMALFLEKARLKETIDFTRTESLQRLAAVSIDPRGPDFEADRLTRTHEAISTSRDHTELNEKLRKGGGSIGYGPFSASANFESDDKVNKAIKETFSSDWSGNDWRTVPKTVNVYQVAGADFVGEAAVRMVNVKPQFWAQTYSKSVAQTFPTVEDVRSATSAGLRDELVMVPVGAMMSYGGDPSSQALPPGWRFCDGAPLKNADFQRLFDAIGTAFGDGRDESGHKVGDFNLPDMRGRFLRGVDHGAGRDPDGLKRTTSRGGNTEDKVGSEQSDQVGKHGHELTDPGHEHEVYWGNNGGRPAVGNPSGVFERGDGGPQGGGSPRPRTNSVKTNVSIKEWDASETRPKNVNVEWIIRMN